MLGLCCCVYFFPLVAAGEDYSLVAVHGLLIAVASLVEYGLQGTRASVVATPRLYSPGSTVVVHRLNCSVARALSFRTRDQTHVSCTGRRILYH